MSRTPKTEELTKLTGTVEGVVFQNEDTGFAILDFGTEENELVTLVGVMPFVAEGEELSVHGRWVHNPKYGRQFEVAEYEKRLPSDSAAILRYLSSGAIKGLGPKRAARIVELFGEDTFEVMEHHPDWLTQVQGINARVAEEIAEEFRRQAGARAAMMFFRTFFGAALTVRIYQAWGSASVDRAKANPFSLCEEIEGVGFERADELATALGIEPDAPQRIESGVLYVLSRAAVG